MDIFGKNLTANSEQDRVLRFGALEMWLRKRPEEWHVATSYDIERENDPSSWQQGTAPDDLKWERWISGDDSASFTLRPRAPDRAVVVRPELPVKLLPGQSTQFYVGLPLWVEVCTGLKNEPLCEFPSIRLSSTWFGTPQEGELCYALRTNAHRSPNQLSRREYRCVCPLQIKNNSSEILSFERICLRCQHLQVFRTSDRFWTNAVRLSYRGGKDWGRVVYSRQPPEQVEAAEAIGEPRKKNTKGQRVKTFLVSGYVGGMP